jgi:O-acetyl-ADP-ribose deacetylase (regulator of RNase III)
MLKVVKQDLLAVSSGVLCHQTNCLGQMGAGIASSIRDKWPHVYGPYRALCDKHKGPRSILLLGFCQIVPVNPGRYVANIFGQHEYGRFATYTDYRAVTEAFKSLKLQLESLTSESSHRQVYVPFKMGCGLAGGDWTKYSAIIEEIFPDAIVCHL